MGLAERRWALEKKTELEAKLIDEIRAIAGNAVEVEIDWEGFATKMDDCNYIGEPGYGLPQLVKALQDVGRDALGQEALRSQLKKIVVRPAPSNDATSFTYADGVVTWEAYFGAYGTGYIYAEAMQKTLEAAL
jgi:hypothetical protein